MKPTKAQRDLAKTFRLHSEALALFNEGWAVAGYDGGYVAWLIEPAGKVHRLPGDEAVARLLRVTSLPVVTVMMTGQVAGRFATDAEKQVHQLARADGWHESAFKGWADQPGKVRDARLATESELRKAAA